MTERKYILPKAESEFVEFKTSFNEDVIETLVAFSNAKGGTVYVGVTDKRVVKGIQIGNETIQNWINEIKNKTAPQIIPDFEILEIESKVILALIVTEYPIKPVSTRGRFYKRIGNSNHLLSVSEVSNMHLQTVNTSWDYYPRPGKTINDISLEKVQKAMDTIKSRNPNFGMDTPEEFLLKNELLFDDGKISNGCYLMFCKGENNYTTIQMGHFASEIVIKDDYLDAGDILSQIEEVMSFIRKHINKEIIITATQIENIQRWQYPLDGIRELVLNMIIHRDYTSSFDSQIKVFSDHILFFNPGSLPDSITIDQLLTNSYVSTPRNRQIAKIVKEMGLIEKYGTGIKRVRSMFIDYNLVQPRFELIPGGFAVTVFAKNENNTTIMNDTLNDTLSDTLNDTLNNRQKSILKLISQNENITNDLIAEELKISLETSKREMAKLINKNMIERIGSRKNGHWKIVGR